MNVDTLLENTRYVCGYGSSTTFDTQILYYLNRVQREIQNEINFSEALVVDTLTMAVGTQSYDLEADFIKMRAIWNDNTYDHLLRRILPEEYKYYGSDIDTQTGTLNYYDIYDESSNVKQIHFIPIPGSIATVPYMYYKAMATLTSGGLANILTTTYPDLYIEGAAFYMFRDQKYIDQPEKIAFRQLQYKEQKQLAKSAQRKPDRIDRILPKRVLPSQTKLYSVEDKWA